MGRRVFMHIDEYGIDGFGQLPHTICVSNPVILWSPSALLLESARAAGATDLTQKDLLNLIDAQDAPVRVVARNEWFDKAWRDRHPFEGARWVSGYDDELAKFSEEDKKLSKENRRVIVARPEKGYEKADRLLCGSLKKSIEAKIGVIFKQGLLPLGTLEKARRDIDARRPYVRTIVRDVYNHMDAADDAEGVISATPCEHLILLSSLVAQSNPTAFTTSDSIGSTVDGDEVSDAIKILKGLKPCVNKSQLFKFLRSGLRRDLQDLLYSERGTKSLSRHIVVEMQRAVKLAPFFDRYLKLKDPIGITVTLGGLTVAIATICLTDQFAFGVLPIAIEAVKAPAVRRGWLPAPVPWGDKTRALFYLCLGTRYPNNQKVMKLCEAVWKAESMRAKSERSVN